MGKKMGINTKAADAKARKAAAKHEADALKKQADEDEYWNDDDKHVNRKLQRKAEREKKTLEKVEHKQTLKVMADQEMEAVAAAVGSGSGRSSVEAPKKVTQAEIARTAEERAAALAAQAAANRLAAAKIAVLDEEPLPENINRITIDGAVASTIDEAIGVLSSGSGASGVGAGDKHPEKRMRAAYSDFEEKYMPALKSENPNLRLSQLRQLLKKEWQKSPENPMNQRMMSIVGT